MFIILRSVVRCLIAFSNSSSFGNPNASSGSNTSEIMSGSVSYGSIS